MNEPAEVKNAKIQGTSLGYEDHGIFTFNIQLDYGGSGQGTGGYCMDTFSPEKAKRIPTMYGMALIMRILEVVGVDKWEDIPGKHIRVRATYCKVEAIGNLLKEDWLDFEKFSREYRTNK